jgi:hypothetical protein
MKPTLNQILMQFSYMTQTMKTLQKYLSLKSLQIISETEFCMLYNNIRNGI